MKTLFLLFALSTFASASEKQKTNPDAVIVCTVKYSKAYHTKQDCDGLDNCKGELKTINLQEAKEMNRHACHYCVKP